MKLRQCLDHIDELKKHISEIEREILRLSDKYEAALNLIRTVPGFDKNPMTAIQVLSEIGGDMSVFPTAKHLVSWAGCCPRNDQSDRKIKSTRISRAGSYFKPVLVQIANALIKSKKHPEFTTRYQTYQSTPWPQESHHCYLSYAPDRYLAHTLRFEAIYSGRLS